MNGWSLDVRMSWRIFGSGGLKVTGPCLGIMTLVFTRS